MAYTGKAKINSEVQEAEEELRHDVELREERRIADERITQQVLNQGMDTGTHSSSHRGVDWGPSYQLRPELERPFPNERQIAARAYQLYLQRRREDGHDLEDWLTAEKELKQR